VDQIDAMVDHIAPFGRRDGATGKLAVHRVEHHEDEAGQEAGPVHALREQPCRKQAQGHADHRNHIRGHAQLRRDPRQHQSQFGPEIFGQQVGHALIGAEIAAPLNLAPGCRGQPLDEGAVEFAQLTVVDQRGRPDNR
jgi:hypothetical protein